MIKIFEHELYKKIYSIAKYVIQLEYEKSNKSYKEYSEHMASTKECDRICDEYTELERLINLTILNHTSYYKRVYNDFETSIFELSKIKFIRTETNDLHNGGAFNLKFNDDSKIYIYKPRSNSPDMFFSNFIDFLDEEKYKHSLGKIKFYNTSNDYSISEWIDKTSVSLDSGSVNVYFAFGQLLSISLLFKMSDLHFDNLKVIEKKIYLFDLETLITPQIAFEHSMVDIFKKSIHNSVFLSCLVPFNYGDKNEELSGFTVSPDRKIYSKELLQIKFPYSNNMHFSKKK